MQWSVSKIGLENMLESGAYGKSKDVPEDFLTDEERARLKNMIDGLWVGPKGLEPSLALLNRDYSGRKTLECFPYSPDREFLGRQDRYLMPKENLGALVGRIKRHEGDQVRTDTFLIGASLTRKLEPSQGGELWLTVNDVTGTSDDKTKLFYFDNLGAFWVKI